MTSNPDYLGDLPILPFEQPKDWAIWLDENHAASPGVWLRLAKKASGIPSVSYGEALEVALCYGWIDGQKKSYDDNWWLTHCRAVNHHSSELVEAHMKAFVNPGRFARMLFIFEDGTKTEPNRHFWELEADYFKKHSLC